MIKKGDLVIKKGKHEAKVYFVEDIDNESILLVNGIRDEYFEGEKDIELFNKQFRLLAKAEHLIEEEKRYRLQYNVPPLLARKYAKPQYLYIRRMDGHEDISFDLGAGPLFQTIFTESEIAEMDITGFEKVEVAE